MILYSIFSDAFKHNVALSNLIFSPSIYSNMLLIFPLLSYFWLGTLKKKLGKIHSFITSCTNLMPRLTMPLHFMEGKGKENEGITNSRAEYDTEMTF